MVIKILGAIDLVIGIIFWIQGIVISVFGAHLFPEIFISFLGMVLLAKGLIFLIGLDVMSFIDVICAAVIMLSPSVKMPFVIYTMVSIFLIQKGVFSFLE